jgi:hypothetical protein
MKIYIAGPITGHMNYKKHFAAAERYLRRKGHITINSSFLPDGLKDYMPICGAMIDQADTVYMLIGHENSAGAKEELIYARYKHKTIFFQSAELKPPKAAGVKRSENYCQIEEI